MTGQHDKFDTLIQNPFWLKSFWHKSIALCTVQHVVREAIIKLAQSKGAGGVPPWKNYKGLRRDIGAGTLLLGSAGLATAQEEEGFASEPDNEVIKGAE